MSCCVTDIDIPIPDGSRRVELFIVPNRYLGRSRLVPRMTNGCNVLKYSLLMEMLTAG